MSQSCNKSKTCCCVENKNHPRVCCVLNYFMSQTGCPCNGIHCFCWLDIAVFFQDHCRFLCCSKVVRRLDVVISSACLYEKSFKPFNQHHRSSQVLAKWKRWGAGNAGELHSASKRIVCFGQVTEISAC